MFPQEKFRKTLQYLKKFHFSEKFFCKVLDFSKNGDNIRQVKINTT